MLLGTSYFWIAYIYYRWLTNKIPAKKGSFAIYSIWKKKKKSAVMFFPTDEILISTTLKLMNFTGWYSSCFIQCLVKRGENTDGIQSVDAT